MTNKTRTIAALAALTMFAASSGPALAQAVAPATPATAAASAPTGAFEILRAGDRDMDCAALSAEFNTLTAGISSARADAAAERQRVAAEQQAKSKRRGLGMGLMRGALSAASLGGFGTGLEGMVAANSAVTAMDTAQGFGQLKDLIGAYRGTPANAGEPATPQQQRLDRVTKLFNEKAC